MAALSGKALDLFLEMGDALAEVRSLSRRYDEIQTKVRGCGNAGESQALVLEQHSVHEQIMSGLQRYRSFTMELLGELGIEDLGPRQS